MTTFDTFRNVRRERECLKWQRRAMWMAAIVWCENLLLAGWWLWTK